MADRGTARTKAAFPADIARMSIPDDIRKALQPLRLQGFYVSKWRDSNPRPFGPEDVVICGKSAAGAYHPRAPFSAAGSITALVWGCVSILSYILLQETTAMIYPVIKVIWVMLAISSYTYSLLHNLFISAIEKVIKVIPPSLF